MRKFLNSCFCYILFLKDFIEFRKKTRKTGKRFNIIWGERYPCLWDKTAKTNIDRHYVYHTAWAARVLSRTKPVYHIDISSYLYFSTIVSAFLPVKFYDYRPADLKISNLSSEFADILHLPFDNGSIKSLSCMHVVEHIGLGRYGDTLDYDGDLKAISQLIRVLAPGGNLLFVVPIGKEPKIMFNAHRIYSYNQIMDYFNTLELKEFALIAKHMINNEGLIYNATQDMINTQTYGCGCFWFTKNAK